MAAWKMRLAQAGMLLCGVLLGAVLTFPKPVTVQPPVEAAESAVRFVTSEIGGYYHRPDCPYAHRRPRLLKLVAAPRGRPPCPFCLAGQEEAQRGERRANDDAGQDAERVTHTE